MFSIEKLRFPNIMQISKAEKSSKIFGVKQFLVTVKNSSVKTHSGLSTVNFLKSPVYQLKEKSFMH